MNYKKLFCMSALSLMLIPVALADVAVANIFRTNMVLQREAVHPVWGTADPGEEVTVTFAGQTLTAKADDKGKWEVRLAPLDIQKTGSALVIKGKNTITFRNVVVGDVWLCSGQSNMDMTFNWGQGVIGRDETLKDSVNYPLIRRVKVQTLASDVPADDIECSPWAISGNNDTGNWVHDTLHWSAAGYIFTRRLHIESGIPMGILDNNWSGSPIEPFMSPESFAEPGLEELNKKLQTVTVGTPEWKETTQKLIADTKLWMEKAEQANAAKGNLPPLPRMTTLSSLRFCYAYFAMMAPITRFPIKGVIWYQGCSNGRDRTIYYHKMHALVKGWRKAWGIDFPFYFVQLASFTKATNDPRGGNGYAFLREAQRKAMDIPKSGMACAIDIGMQNDIHPRNKIDVGERLALWALRDEYGKKDIVVSGPLFKAVKFENGKAIVSFDYAKGLMTAKKDGISKPVATPGEKPKHFAICGADKKWVWADAVIEGETVVLSSPEVKEPVAVRYAFRAYPDGVNMYNEAGLPMVPFRTDDEKK